MNSATESEKKASAPEGPQPKTKRSLLLLEQLSPAFVLRIDRIANLEPGVAVQMAVPRFAKRFMRRPPFESKQVSFFPMYATTRKPSIFNSKTKSS